MNRQQGFTLIELSIVLVIIGLIAGGVLMGRDLIEAAKMRSTINELQQYRTAINTFRLKYNCIPGDCPNAVAFGLGTSGGPGDNGNGNGDIDSGGNGNAGASNTGTIGGGYWTSDKEMGNFWYHLQKAGLIQSNLTGYTTPFTSAADYAPKLKNFDNVYLWVFSLFNSVNGSVTPNQRVMIIGGMDASLNYNISFSVNQSYYIDLKMDDGAPASGAIRAFYPYSSPQIANYANDSTCVSALGCTMNLCSGEPNQYDLQGKWRWNFPYNGTGTYDQSGQYGSDFVECGMAMLNAF